MKYSVITKKLAKEDIIKTYSWYEEKRVGLSDTFIKEIEIIFNRIENNPYQFPVINRLYRKAVLKRFSFIVFFIIEEEYCFVIAVFHVSRNPIVWKKRN